MTLYEKLEEGCCMGGNRENHNNTFEAGSQEIMCFSQKTKKVLDMLNFQVQLDSFTCTSTFLLTYSSCSQNDLVSHYFPHDFHHSHSLR